MFKNYRSVVALLLFFAGMLNYLDRAALSVMAPLVKKDLHIDDAQMGILFSCFFIGYCLFCFLGGWGAVRTALVRARYFPGLPPSGRCSAARPLWRAILRIC